MHHIATRIEALRNAKGLSVAGLAEKAAISRMTLGRRLVDPSSFKLAELDRVAAVLGTTAEDLTARDVA